MSEVVEFTVEFDSQVWASMTRDERSEWIDSVEDLISTEAYVSSIRVKSKCYDCGEEATHVYRDAYGPGRDMQVCATDGAHYASHGATIEKID